MKARTLALLAGTGGPLLLSSAADAEFTGLNVTSKPNEFGLFVCNVYATFDAPGDDFMLAVAGTLDNPLVIEVLDGTFYQHPGLDSDRPPQAVLVDVFPSLAYDTFVTIGVKQVDPDGRFGGQPEDHMVLTVEFPGFGASVFTLTNHAWVVTPFDPQADPFNPDFVAGDGQILIGQFATADGTGFQGTMLLQFLSSGEFVQQVVSFTHVVPGPGTAALLALWGLCGSRRRRPSGRTSNKRTAC